MIKKSEITHGALFAIPLWNELGFFYGKMLFGSHLKNTECRRQEIFIRVYDHYTKELKTDFQPDFFKDAELYTDPFPMVGNPKLRGPNKWIFLKHDLIYDNDEFIHHYMQADYFDMETTVDNQKFWILKFGNLNNPKNEFFPYYRIKHLSVYRRKSQDMIGLALTFDWLRRNKKNPDDYFEFKDGLDIRKTVRYEVLKMSLDYSKIPKELRGRIAPEVSLM